MKKLYMLFIFALILAFTILAVVKLATGDQGGDQEYKLYIPNVRMECSPGYDCTPQSEPTQIPED